MTMMRRSALSAFAQKNGSRKRWTYAGARFWLPLAAWIVVYVGTKSYVRKVTSSAIDLGDIIKKEQEVKESQSQIQSIAMERKGPVTVTISEQEMSQQQKEVEEQMEEQQEKLRQLEQKHDEQHEDMTEEQEEEERHLEQQLEVEVEQSKQRQITELDMAYKMKVVKSRLGLMEALSLEEMQKRGKEIYISIVISHCESHVHWIPRWAGLNFKIRDITVYSKCGQEVKGLARLMMLAPTKVIKFDNVGRCDHTYAYWIKENYKEISDGKQNPNDVVIFMKDNKRFRTMYRKIEDVFSLATETGFVCLKKPECDCHKPCNMGRHEPTMMHRQSYSMGFSLDEYARMDRDKNTVFLNDQYRDLQSWKDAMGIHLPAAETIPVCYNGLFGATKKQVLNQSFETWEKITNSLARADNIIEGHYAERMWASLLSEPDEIIALEVDKAILPVVKDVVKKPSNGLVCGMLGMLYVRHGENFKNYFPSV